MTLTVLDPPADRVLLRQHAAETETGFGLVIPENVAERPLRATVLAVGAGPIDSSGRQHPIGLSVGDVVLIPKYGGTEIEYEGEGEGAVISILASEILARYLESGRCRVCGCTDEEACEGGCSWADNEHTVCDRCT